MARGQGSKIFENLCLHQEIFISSFDGEVNIIELLDGVIEINARQYLLLFFGSESLFLDLFVTP